MLCAISGEAPEEPVASSKSGIVFERRLIDAYISEHGTDPVTGEPLTTEDLITLKSARVVKPRPPTLTSIPSLLSVFQQEWDAMALESYQLKQSLTQLRNELSTALYNNDAAVRVIARLSKERDDARDALGKMSLNDRRAATNGDGGEDAMQVDGAELPASLAAKVDTTQERLSKTRKKRPVPQEWAAVDQVQAYDQQATVQLGSSGTCMNTNASHDVYIAGGNGACHIYTTNGQTPAQALPVGQESVTDVGMVEGGGQSFAIVATAAGSVKLFRENQEQATLSEHGGPVAGVAIHPCGAIMGSVSSDKSFVFYDLETFKPVSRVYTDSQLTCCDFHPDGHLFAAGAADGQIKIFDVKSSSVAASFETTGPLQSLHFSENGIWLAAVVRGSSSASIWDLRKGNEVAALDFGTAITKVCWDYTGQYLAGVGAGGVAVQHYDKSAKAWSEVLRKAVPGVAVVWGKDAKSLSILTAAGSLETLA